MASGSTVVPSPPTLEVYRPYQCYLPNCCNYCKAVKTPKLNLMRCSRCKVVSYCGAEHQKKDFPKHKDICKVIKDIADKGEKFFVGAVRNEKDWKAYRMARMNLVSKQLNRKCEEHEVSMLLNQECCQVCFRPDQPLHPCALCHTVSFCSSHSQVSPITSQSPQKTGGAKKKGAVSTHKDCCEIYQWESQCEQELVRYFEHWINIEKTREGPRMRIVEEGEPEKVLNYPPANSYYTWRSTLSLEGLLSAMTTQMAADWDAFFVKVGIPNFELPQLLLMTEALTHPLTVASCIKEMIPPANLIAMEKMTIHIIGATTANEYAHPLRYEEILHLFPRVSHLEVVLIGSDLPVYDADDDFDGDAKETPSAPKARIISLAPLCNECIKAKKTLTVARCKGLYQRYMDPFIDSILGESNASGSGDSGSSATPAPAPPKAPATSNGKSPYVHPRFPTMAFAFNSGIHSIGDGNASSEGAMAELASEMLSKGSIKERSQFEEVEREAEADKWGATIDFLIQYSIPTVFTALNEENCKMDAVRLAIQGAQMSIDPRANPFRSMRPRRDPWHQTKFCYSNHWLLAIEGPLQD